MDATKTVKYLILHYFTGPAERIGIPFVLLASAGKTDRLIVHEASKWRAEVNSRDLMYLEALLLSFLVEKHNAAVLFSELDNMSAGSVRIVERGSATPQKLARLIT